MGFICGGGGAVIRRDNKIMGKQKPLKAGVIGCGILARQQHIPNIIASSRYELSTCCDLSEEALKICRDEFKAPKVTRDYREAVADPDVDVIIVATTETFRVPVVELAAKYGKPVYSEKPLADILENGRRIAQLVESSGIPFCIGHNRRASPAMRDAQAWVQALRSQPNPCPWRFDREGPNRKSFPNEGGAAMISIRINDDWFSWKNVHLEGDNMRYGLLLAELTHFVDLACWFSGSEPVSVSVTSSGALNHAVAVRFKNNDIASVVMGSNGSFGYPKELLEVMANGGFVAVDHMLEVRTAGVPGADLIRKYPMLNDRHPTVGTEGGLYGWLAKKAQACREAEEQGNPLLQFTAEPDKGHFRLLESFADEIQNGTAPLTTVRQGLTAMTICHAAIRSHEEGREVKLSELG